MKGHIAAQIARDAATDQSSPMYLTLSAQMCWDAAVECQVKAGAARPAAITTAKHDHVISEGDSPISSKGEMEKVPQGAIIGFFRGGTLVHCMIATGAGIAAGNKNECIGHGSPIGWETINLAEDLNWQQGGFLDGGSRLTLLRYRAL